MSSNSAEGFGGIQDNLELLEYLRMGMFLGCCVLGQFLVLAGFKV